MFCRLIDADDGIHGRRDDPLQALAALQVSLDAFTLAEVAGEAAIGPDEEEQYDQMPAMVLDVRIDVACALT